MLASCPLLAPAIAKRHATGDSDQPGLDRPLRAIGVTAAITGDKDLLMGVVELRLGDAEVGQDDPNIAIAVAVHPRETTDTADIMALRRRMTTMARAGGVEALKHVLLGILRLAPNLVSEAKF